ncbi:hypothetical protein B0H10DRAFT_2240868 [Mycena sp. CBHHK59/15]|nr:hypothetical protein B0H10DRAFT_2240868 [Mycena sp. CBHHK59/15]
MEAKLKTLKVVDLRDILAKAHEQPPQKATKADLVARILASPAAAAVYNAKFAPKDDLLAPPEDLDWDVDQPVAPVEQPIPASKPASKPVSTPASKPAANPASKPAVAPAPAPAPTPAAPMAEPAPAASSADADAELEKRRKRAERFGVPLLESRPPQPKKTPVAKQPDNPEKLNARAARSGSAQKRAAPVEEVDPEEQERRRKRAERFGTGPVKA